MPSIQVAPSLLSADFSKLADEIKNVEKAGASFLHLDVMDGHFVPNITFGPCIVEAVKKCSTLSLDVHLMIEHPEKYIEDFVKAGANKISVHAEACTHLHRVIQQIKQLNVDCGIALNPHTPLDVLDFVLEELDFVLIMTVNPGFGGQSFIPSMIPKLQKLHEMIQKKNYNISIEVDGGINDNTAKQVMQAGANWLVAGSYIFKHSSYEQAIKQLRQTAK